MSHVQLFKHYIPLPVIVLGMLEAMLLFASLFVGNAIRFDTLNDELLFDVSVVLSAVVFAVGMLACTAAMGVYSTGLRDGNGPMAVRTLVAYCLLGCAFLTIIYYLVPGLYMGRGVLAYSIIVALVLVIPMRWVFLRMVDTESLRNRLLVLGVGEKAKRLSADLAKGHSGVARVVGFVQVVDSEKIEVDGKIFQLKQNESLYNLASRLNVSEIVVALDERRSSDGSAFPLDQLFACKLQGVRVSNAIEVAERELGVLEIAEIKPGWLVFSKGFSSSQFWNGIKRFFDISIALVLLLLTWPLMIIFAAAVFFETGAPILYRQVRVGFEGQHFEILKFRSMCIDAEKDGTAVWAQSNDARVTRVGSIMRNTRIDELPQLFNVLRGDMSIVGPRPERPSFVKDLSEALPFYAERHHVKPGLMGWAQLNYPYGATVEDAANKLRYDLYYVKNRSLLLDIIIMVQTVQVILLGIGVR